MVLWNRNSASVSRNTNLVIGHKRAEDLSVMPRSFLISKEQKLKSNSYLKYSKSSIPARCNKQDSLKRTIDHRTRVYAVNNRTMVIGPIQHDFVTHL